MYESYSILRGVLLMNKPNGDKKLLVEDYGWSYEPNEKLKRATYTLVRQPRNLQNYDTKGAEFIMYYIRHHFLRLAIRGDYVAN